MCIRHRSSTSTLRQLTTLSLYFSYFSDILFTLLLSWLVWWRVGEEEEVEEDKVKKMPTRDEMEAILNIFHDRNVMCCHALYSWKVSFTLARWRLTLIILWWMDAWNWQWKQIFHGFSFNQPPNTRHVIRVYIYELHIYIHIMNVWSLTLRMLEYMPLEYLVIIKPLRLSILHFIP